MSQVAVFAVIATVVAVPAIILIWKRLFVMIRLCPCEILLVETTEERERLVMSGTRAFGKQRVRTPWACFAVSLLAVYAFENLTGMMTLDGEWTLTRADGVRAGIARLLTLFPLAVLFFLLYNAWRRSMRMFLRRYLNAHGMPICMSCGYDLRDHIPGICPECGRSAESTEENIPRELSGDP